MERAGQTPHGARPNREEAWFRPGACRLGAPNLRVGRLSCAAMRGLEEWPPCRVKLADRIRLTGPAAFKICRCLLVVGKAVIADRADDPFSYLGDSYLGEKSCPHLAVVLRFAAAALATKKSRSSANVMPLPVQSPSGHPSPRNWRSLGASRLGKPC